MRATLCIAICFTLWVSLFSGCAKPEYKRSSATKIVLKLGTIRFNDLGYIHYSDEAIKLELYSAGTSLVALELYDDEVCIEQGCLAYGAFYEKMGIAALPAAMLRHIFEQQPILDGKNITRDAQGFTQRISDASMQLYYRVEPNKVTFKARKRHIIITLHQL